MVYFNKYIMTVSVKSQAQNAMTVCSNIFQKENRITQKCFLHYSLASRRSWAAPADLYF